VNALSEQSERVFMRVIHCKADLRAYVSASRCSGLKIGFVPTMGALHEGHLSLIRRAHEEADCIVVSIFVNPTQFGPGEDLDTYPRDVRRDESLCKDAGVDVVFYPTVGEMYASDHSVFVSDEGLAGVLCGALRPGHFQGVLTVVAKLFNLVQPDVAVFGQKDAQQARLIERMVRDLDFSVRIVVSPIVRESDGLAMSSRNRYLTAEERGRATCLSRALDRASALYAAGCRDAETLRMEMLTLLAEAEPEAIDYAVVVDNGTLVPVDQITGPVLVALAVRFSSARLIDNVVLGDWCA
jgi:pantoate--beta-alanine ligase